MDHKSWVWRKKSTEKTTVSKEEANKGNEEEVLASDKADLEKDLKVLSQKLSSAISNSSSKDDLVEKNEKLAQEAIAGWERAEMEAILLKQEVGTALRQRLAAEDRLMQFDAALKECMNQLRSVREEQEQRIRDAVTESSRGSEKRQLVLEENLEESRRKLSELGLENSHFSKSLLAKEKLIEELDACGLQAEARLTALTDRLESLEKDNTSLKYEVRVLEKELQIRIKERDFNIQTADASHKKHLESAKKIAKLESECQKLRVLVRKRLPGPATVAKMKNEVELLGKDDSPSSARKRITMLAEQLCAMEEENKALKEKLQEKTNELQPSRTMFPQTASKLSQVDPRRMSDTGSDDNASCAESWASAIISESNHFKIGKQNGTWSHKTGSVSDIDLMGDFVEMEKLATVDLSEKEGRETIPVSSHRSGLSVASVPDTNLMDDFIEMEKLAGVSADEPSIESYACAEERNIVPVSGSNRGSHSGDVLLERFPDWLQNVLKVILKQPHVRRKNPDQILEDIRVSLAYVNNSNPSKLVNAKESLNHPHDGCLSWKPPIKYSVMDSFNDETGVDVSLIKKEKQFHSELDKSVSKMIELIEGISLPSQDQKMPESSTEYLVRVFQWKTSDLTSILQKFVHSCCDLLNEEANFQNFVQELASVLDWTVNHCFPLQDVPGMKCAVKKQFDTESESEAESGMASQFSEKSYLPPAAALNVYNGLFQMEDLQTDVREENKKLKDRLVNIESAKNDLEERLHAATNQREKSSMFELQESEKRTASLQIELEDQIEQLNFTRSELSEVRKKSSSLELELINRTNCCEELEATCLELQIQMDCVMKKEVLKNEVDQEEKALRTDWDITAASEKLAECQETILNLGKQLEAMSSPGEATLSNNVLSNQMDTQTPVMNQRSSSLLGRMLAEDNAAAKDFKSPMMKETVCTVTDEKSQALGTDAAKEEAIEKGSIVDESKENDYGALVGSLSIVPNNKRRGWGFMTKLFRRKKSSSKKKASKFAD